MIQHWCMLWTLMRTKKKYPVYFLHCFVLSWTLIANQGKIKVSSQLIKSIWYHLLHFTRIINNFTIFLDKPFSKTFSVLETPADNREKVVKGNFWFQYFYSVVTSNSEKKSNGEHSVGNRDLLIFYAILWKDGVWYSKQCSHWIWKIWNERMILFLEK